MKFKNFIALSLSMVMTTSLMVSTASATPLSKADFFDKLKVNFIDTVGNISVNVTSQGALSPEQGFDKFTSTVDFKYDKVTFDSFDSSVASVASLTVNLLDKDGATVKRDNSNNTTTAALEVGKNRIVIDTTDSASTSAATTWEIVRKLGMQSQDFVNVTEVTEKSYSENDVAKTAKYIVKVPNGTTTFNLKLTSDFTGVYGGEVTKVEGATPSTSVDKTDHEYLNTTGAALKFDVTDATKAATATVTVVENDLFSVGNDYTYTIEISREASTTTPSITVPVSFYKDNDLQVLIETVEVTSGTALGVDNMPDVPTKEGSTFKDWRTEAGVEFTAGTEVTGPTKVYATWSENQSEDGKVNVYFYSDKNIQLYTIQVDKGTSLGDKMPVDPTKPNYRFDGWYTEVNPPTKVDFTKDTIVSGNIEVYASWTATTPVTPEEKVTVYFYSDKGTQPLHTIEVTSGSSLGAAMPANPTKTNYRFDGWYTEVNTGTTTAATTESFTATTIVNASIEVYASWTYYYTSSNGGSSSGGGGYTKSPINTNSSVPSTSTDATTTTAGDNTVKNLLAGNKAVSIDLGTKTSVELGAKSFADLMKADKPLTLAKGETSLTISTTFMKALGLDGSGTVAISISPAKNATVAGAEGVDPKNKDLLALSTDISIKVGGKEVREFTTPLDISIDVTKAKLSDAQLAKLTGVRILSNGKVNQLGGNIASGKFTMKTSKLSQYGVIISNSLVKILTTVGTKSFTVNGQKQSADVAPMISDGRTMVPVRFIAEALGADVSWNKGTKTATIVLDGKTVTARVDSLSAGMDVAPFIEDGRTMVPLRYISEQLDANVIWNASSRTVEINR